MLVSRMRRGGAGRGWAGPRGQGSATPRLPWWLGACLAGARESSAPVYWVFVLLVRASLGLGIAQGARDVGTCRSWQLWGGGGGGVAGLRETNPRGGSQGPEPARSWERDPFSIFGSRLCCTLDAQYLAPSGHRMNDGRKHTFSYPPPLIHFSLFEERRLLIGMTSPTQMTVEASR